MLHHVKRIAKKKSVIGFSTVVAVTGTIIGTQFNAATTTPRYIMAAVSRGPLIVSVNGSGQVSGENQIDIKPSVSGVITRILVKTNEEVKTGTPLFEVDRKSALKTVRDAAQSVNDARLSLASAQLSLQKLKKDTDPVSLIQAQNNLRQAERDLAKLKAGADAADLQQAQNELDAQKATVELSYDGKTPKTIRSAYDNAVQSLKSIASTLQQSLTDADTVLGIDNMSANDGYEHWLSVLDTRPLNLANAQYAQTKTIVSSFKQQADALTTSGEDTTVINASFVQAQTALDSMVPLLQYVQDALANSMTNVAFSQSTQDGLKNMIQSDRTSVASKVSTLASQTQSIDQAKTTYANSLLSIARAQNALTKLQTGATAAEITTAEERVAAAQASLDKTMQGTDALDIAMSENSVAQRRSSLIAAQNRLADAQETLNDYTIRAPFDGIMARMTAHVADQASPSASLGTLLTQAKIAGLTLNEVDATKIKTGQKATLTFDAIPDLTIAGVVSEVDSIGAVAQGVVSYPIKIAFATQDERIKTGMSVSASIVTDIHADTLLVPNAAIRSGITGHVVQTLQGSYDKVAAVSSEGVASATAPQMQTVRTGLTNEQTTEVTEGLKEGDLIIIRTIDPATASKAPSVGSSSVRLPGVGGSGAAGGGNRTFTTGR